MRRKSIKRKIQPKTTLRAVGTNHKTHMHCTHTHQKLLRTILVRETTREKDIECIFSSKHLKPWKIEVMTNWKLSRKKLARFVSAWERKERVRWRECVCSQNHVYQKAALSLSYMSIINFQHYKCHVTTSKTADFNPVYEFLGVSPFITRFWRFFNENHGSSSSFIPFIFFKYDSILIMPWLLFSFREREFLWIQMLYKHMWHEKKKHWANHVTDHQLSVRFELFQMRPIKREKRTLTSTFDMH